MARQNIDEEWKTDPRRDALIERLKDSRLADGARVQLNWLILAHKAKPVPLKKFKFVKDYDVYVECGLAEIRGEFVHISGADRYSDFFEKQSANASKPRKPKPSQKKPKIAKANQIKPIEPSISFSSSFSSSDSGSNSEDPVSSKQTKAGAFIVGYKSRFLNRWNTKIDVQGKDAGIAKRVAEGLTYEQIETYLDTFFYDLPDAEVVKKKHPIFLFENKLTEIVVRAQTGNFTTTTQARQADNMASNHLLMEKLKREGK